MNETKGKENKRRKIIRIKRSKRLLTDKFEMFLAIFLIHLSTDLP